MKKQFKITIVILVTILSTVKLQSQITHNKTQVLNLGVFHMGGTSDANSTKYDESSVKATKEIKEVVEALANFKPTIILVEHTPKYQKKLEQAYQKYLINSKADIGYYGKCETGLLGFAIGKIANTKRVYGIDHRMGYDYTIGDSIAKKEKMQKYLKVQEDLMKKFNELADETNVVLKEHLLAYNTQKGYDLMINGNADVLTYASSKNGFEGADEAAKYYQRNLRMFSNINKIKSTNKDRILIISGASHAAFFDMFMKRSPIYELVKITNYLKE